MLKQNVFWALAALALFAISGLTLAVSDLTTNAAAPVRYTGVNLAGADFGGHALPGTYNQDYTYPTRGEVDYFTSKGMNTFRLPFLWERLQRAQNADFDQAEQARIDEFVNYATGKGAYVLLDPHNYARYYNGVIGRDVPVSAFTDFWTKLAARYKGNSRVIFGLMNEPYSMPTELWRDDANAAIAAIRATGATNLILVPGNAWTGAHSWSSNWYGTPNAIAMLEIYDPGNNFAFEVHQYLDNDSSGTTDQCVSQTIGAERLVSFTNWLRQHNKRGFLGEFGGGRNSTCYAALDNMLTYIDNNSDVWLGWTYWAAGPWWGDYQYTLEPTGCPSNCTDRPQMASLLPHVAGSAPTPTPTPSPSPTATPSGLEHNAVYELEPSCAAGKRLDVSGAGTADGTGLIIWSDTNGSNQRWRAEAVGNNQFELIPLHAQDRRLDVNGQNTADGTKIQIWHDNNTAAQRWRAIDAGNGYWELEPASGAGKRLDVSGAGSANGTIVHLWTDNNTAAQRWRLLKQ